MSTPKKRKSHTRKTKRRSHHALKKISLSKCANCGEPNLPHCVCPNCHMYKGKKVAELAD